MVKVFFHLNQSRVQIQLKNAAVLNLAIQTTHAFTKRCFTFNSKLNCMCLQIGPLNIETTIDLVTRCKNHS